MTVRVPCKDCGAEILPVTAEMTGGVCMACNSGIRENLERSKAYYQKQKEYDPSRELWSSLVKRVYNEEGGGLNQLSDDEKTYYAVCSLDGEVWRGGLETFFTNSSGSLYNDVVKGLETLGAFQTRDLVVRAKTLLYGDVELPKSQIERDRLIKQRPDDASGEVPKWVEEFEQVENAYHDDPEEIGNRLDAFARDRGLVQPFEKR